MKIQESELQRRKEIHEYLTTTHMFCLFVMMFALVLSKKMFSITNYNITSIRFLFFFAATLLGFVLITTYNTKNASLNDSIKFTWIDFIYISFPLGIAAFTLFVVGKTAYSAETILLLPVIITSSILGKKAGLIMAGVGTVIIYFENIISGTTTEIFLILQSNLILVSVMFIVAWFTGAQTDLENQHRRQLTKLANTDFLTGLFNYGYFQEKISEYVKDASYSNPLGLIMLDIDYFKHYNDIHGHQAGDSLISKVGDILNAKVNSDGFVSRYGGDEFVIVLRDTDTKKAMQVAEELSKTISSQHFHGEEYQPEGKITISCGIAICPTHAANAKDLVKYADQALYRAKSLYKNKVELYFSVFDNLDVEEDEAELLNSIRTLVSVINAKDRYTYGHSERVTDHALKLAKRIGLPQEDIHLLGYAAFLHDIGKIELDRDLLNKVGPLTDKEWQMIQNHSRWGSDIVKAMKQLQPTAPVILHHHENYNGTGYPAKLKGEEIPILARIIRIADSYDAMISHRPYKKHLDISAALEEIRSNSGVQFDPELASVFMDIIRDEFLSNNIS
ncbi:MAG TPA: diguanylate cyclase [Syntrophomonadaceae bacterium]|nr:diguanylate cyclase [Syntrophomonadaceae bacterium]